MRTKIESIVDQFHRMVSSDGASIELLQTMDGIVSVRYALDSSGCRQCVIDGETLRQLLLEALQSQGIAVRDVAIVSTMASAPQAEEGC